MGSVIYKISRREVEKVGRIIPIKATMVAVGEDGDKRDRTAFDIAQRELIIENDDYHQKIIQIVNAFPEDKTLILVDTNNVEDLGKALEAKIKDSVFIYGKTTNKRRHQALDALKSGELKCLIGGKILKRGLDIKGGIHNLIICGGGKLHSDFDQKVGRAVRLNERGWARLFCFFHLDNHYLYKHSKEQLKSIVEMGYRVKVAVHGQTLNGEDLIKARFRLPKKKA
jgi:superfamily II DNA/RNA helicase